MASEPVGDLFALQRHESVPGGAGMNELPTFLETFLFALHLSALLLTGAAAIVVAVGFAGLIIHLSIEWGKWLWLHYSHLLEPPR